MNIEAEIHTLLGKIGVGRMDSLAYDTAWVARLGDVDWKLSNQALEWLCANQLEDGSWGAKDVFYYHDRVISTLAAMIALTYRGKRARDKEQIERGLRALERITSGATQGLAADPNGATVGFEMIIPTLVVEAEKLGIIKQQGERILGKMRFLRERKMQKLAGLKISKSMTAAFSSEMAGIDNQQILDIENLQESNGSIGSSPSATAYYSIFVKPGDPAALDYLHKFVNPSDGVPNLVPFEIFEANWVLWNLALVKENWDRNQEMDQNFRNALQLIKNSWRPGKGIGLSAAYSVPDGDDTLFAFELLSRFDETPDMDAIFTFKEGQHFCAYPQEAHSSNSLNIHAIGTLRQVGYEKNSPVIISLLDYLQQSQNPEGYWFDKWNLSPYYTTSHAVIICAGFANYLIEKPIEWILKTQRRSGAWGHQIETAEETAYALQALCFWKRSGGAVPNEVISRGLGWLTKHLQDSYPPLWIGKALYCPELVVQATILSAIQLTKQTL